MIEEFDNSGQVVRFEELADHLLDQGLQSSPSALHGCLCGLLSAGASSQQEYCLNAISGALDVVLHGELAAQIMSLYSITAAALEDEAFEFHPLLPDDDTDIAVRVDALAEWCKGFLAGFAHASVGRDSAPSALSEDSSEILKDFAEIAQAGFEEQGDDEESEGNYMELLEYLRFATLNLFMDNALGTGDDQPAPGSIH